MAVRVCKTVPNWLWSGSASASELTASDVSIRYGNWKWQWQCLVCRRRSLKFGVFARPNTCYILILHIMPSAIFRWHIVSHQGDPHSANSRNIMPPSKIFLQREGLERNGKEHWKAEIQASLAISISSIFSCNKVPFWRENWIFHWKQTIELVPFCNG